MLLKIYRIVSNVVIVTNSLLRTRGRNEGIKKNAERRVKKRDLYKGLNRLHYKDDGGSVKTRGTK